ncbi:MFS transporter [Streptomyces sp. NPDC058646]|uniref:MFS transporter n=1 Tax=Streptomyces sp. NPDC058646 TaxID=3346574 RepID=UPI00366817D3
MITSFVRSNYASLRGPTAPLAVLHLLDSVGNGLFLASSTVYFVVVAGLPTAQVGIGLSLAGLTGFFSSVLMGRAADRFGARRMLMISMLALAGVYCMYPMVDSAPTFFVVVALVGALEWGSGPLFHTLVMDLVPESDRVTARAALRSVFNVGFSAGALVAAGLIGIGGAAMQALPLGNALSFVLAALVVVRLPVTHPGPPPERASRFRALRDVPFLGVIGVSTLLALNGTVLAVGVPLWLLGVDGVPRSVIPLVFILNTVLVVLLQVRAARGADTLDGAVAAARRSGLVSAAACLVMVLGGLIGSWATVGVAVVAVLLITAGELWQSAGAFGIGYGLAPDTARGEYLGAFHLRMVAQATLGPAAVAWFATDLAPYGWAIVAAALLAGAVLIGPAVRRAERDRATAV